MRTCFVVTALSLVCGAAAPAAAQSSGAPANTYASLATLPDWSGIWVRPWAEFEADNAERRAASNPNAPRLTAQAVAARDSFQKTSKAGGAGAPQAGTCAAAPAGVPGVMRFPFGLEFLFTPGRVTLLLEQGSTIRRIDMDGRQHSADADSTYVGESIGRWEGDTLVIDTRGIKSAVLLSPGIPSSGEMRVVERIRRINPTHLEIETVIEDPVMLAAPWRWRATYERSTLGWFERECDSDRDGRDQEPDLTPPPAQR